MVATCDVIKLNNVLYPMWHEVIEWFFAAN